MEGGVPKAGELKTGSPAAAKSVVSLLPVPRKLRSTTIVLAKGKEQAKLGTLCSFLAKKCICVHKPHFMFMGEGAFLALIPVQLATASQLEVFAEELLLLGQEMGIQVEINAVDALPLEELSANVIFVGRVREAGCASKEVFEALAGIVQIILLSNGLILSCDVDRDKQTGEFVLACLAEIPSYDLDFEWLLNHLKVLEGPNTDLMVYHEEVRRYIAELDYESH